MLAQTIEFLKRVHKYTAGPICFCALPNAVDGPVPKSIFGPGEKRLTQWIDAHANFSYGFYFSTGRINASLPIDERARIKDKIGEIGILWVDIDFKTTVEDEGTILVRLKDLECPPSIIVRSGGGIHAYWCLNEALDVQALRDEIEDALKVLARRIGADPAPQHIAAVMRLPGTWNTKRDKVMCEVIHQIEAEYDFVQLQEWLREWQDEPILTYRASPKAAGKKPGTALVQRAETNPFIEAGEAYGLHEKQDAFELLANMVESLVHVTQVKATAILLNDRMPKDEVVDLVLNVTMAQPQAGKWNARKERKKITEMCDTWLADPRYAENIAKQEAYTADPGPALGAIETVADAVDDKVVPQEQLAAARARKAAQTIQPREKKKDPAPPLAAHVLRMLRAQGMDLHVDDRGWTWRIYRGGAWERVSDEDKKLFASMMYAKVTENGWTVRRADVATAMEYLEFHATPRSQPDWDDLDLLGCANGVVRLSDQAAGVMPHSPNHWLTRRIAAPFDYHASCPLFTEMLMECLAKLPDADQCATVIWEFFGYALKPQLFPNREARRALILVGRSRTGKTFLATMLRLLIGNDRCTSMTVPQISGPHGIEQFLVKTAWIADDAAKQGDRIDTTVFKLLITGEPLAINPKGTKIVSRDNTHIPVLLTLNQMFAAFENSEAVTNRSMILNLDRVFSEDDTKAKREHIGCGPGNSIPAVIFDLEAAGILNMALRGMEQLTLDEGYVLPASMQENLVEFGKASNPMREFNEECIEESSGLCVIKNDLCNAFRGWESQQRGARPVDLNTNVIMRSLRAIYSKAEYGDIRKRVPGSYDRPRCIKGLSLNEEGKKYLKQWRVVNNIDEVVYGPNLAFGDVDQDDDDVDQE